MEKTQDLEVRILEVSRENRRISLGLKQLEDDPWPELSKTFESGKEIEGEIVRILDKGIILSLQNDVEGIVPFGRQVKKNKKSVISKYKIGEKINAKNAIAVVKEVKNIGKNKALRVVFTACFTLLYFGSMFFILYGLPEGREVSRNLPGARGVVFPKYEPIPSHGDPIHPKYLSLIHI